MTIGYTQGTFDVLHVGHINLLQYAKNDCDYLIVGINSDQLVREYKHHNTSISQQERMEIIKAIKYVDEVVLCTTLDKIDAWNKHHFNKIYIGSDWQGSERWKKSEEDLKPLGTSVVYVPLVFHDCDKVSSSQIKKEIVEKYEN